MSIRRLPVSCLALALVVAAGCREHSPPPTAEAAPVADAAPASVTTPSPAPADVPPMPQTPSGPMPASGTITYAGFGPAAFGADEEAVRMAWGRDLAGMPGEPGGCHVLAPAPRERDALRLGFMIEAGKFSRIDVTTPDIVAPGGGKVGMTTAQIEALYPNAQSMPHKYVEGASTLRVADRAGGAAALVFETDAKGTITAWRIGIPPQVDYVEGCA
jgi:hypothetical protein